MSIFRRASAAATTAFVVGMFRKAMEGSGMFALVASIFGASGALIMTFWTTIAIEWKVFLFFSAMVAFPAAIILMVTAFMLIRNFIRSFNSESYWRWSEKLDHVIAHRETLWSKANKFYVEWQQNSVDAPAELRSLVQSAEFPAGILKLKNRPLSQFDLTDGLSVNSKKLAAFANGFYPSSEGQKSFSIDANDEFYDARKALAKFWDFTGRLHFHFMDLSEYELEDPLRTCADDIVFLVYLEWALARQQQSAGVGKQGLFKLCKLVSKQDWR